VATPLPGVTWAARISGAKRGEEAVGDDGKRGNAGKEDAFHPRLACRFGIHDVRDERDDDVDRAGEYPKEVEQGPGRGLGHEVQGHEPYRGSDLLHRHWEDREPEEGHRGGAHGRVRRAVEPEVAEHGRDLHVTASPSHALLPQPLAGRSRRPAFGQAAQQGIAPDGRPPDNKAAAGERRSLRGLGTQVAWEF